MGAESRSPAAQPLDPNATALPENVQEVLDKGKHSWLKSTEVCDLLLHYATYNLKVEKEPPCQPPGGSLFLFDRKAVRFFRKDNHNWRKKADGKTVRETHEKLKVGNVDMLNCYYAQADRDDGLQRRCYWLLESEKDIVLVHYLNIPQRQHPSRVSTRMHRDRLTRQASSEPEASLDSETDPSDEPSHASDMEAAGPAVTADNAVQHPAAASADAHALASELRGPNPSSMSFDTFLAAMDSQGNCMLPGQAGNYAAQEMLRTWKEELHPANSAGHCNEARNWNDMAPNLNTQSMPYRTSLQTSDHSPCHSSHSNNSNQMPQTMSANQQTAARWLAEEGTNHEGSTHLRHVASMFKRTTTQFGQPQFQISTDQISTDRISTDHTSLSNPQQQSQHAPSEHMSDKELSWSLAQHQQKAVKDQRLPAYSLSSSAACTDIKAAIQQQHVSQPLGDLSLFMPLQSMSLQMLSQQIPSASYDQAGRPLNGHGDTAGPPGSPAHAQGSHGQTDLLSQCQTYQQRTQESHALLQSSRQQSLASQAQPASELQHTSTSGVTQQDAFERPHGLSSFSMPFMNAPHSLHNSMQGSRQESARFANGSAAPMVVCQDHSVSSTSASNAKPWQNAVGDAFELAVPTHLKPPVILISQAQGTVGEYAKPPYKVSPFAVEKASPSASLDGNEHSQHASTSYSRHGLSGHGVSEASDTAGLSQQPSGSEALRKAALSLNAQLALIDKQVLQHVIPQAQQSPGRHHSQDMAQQVQACEEQLRQLELNSQHLMQLPAQESTAQASGTVPQHGQATQTRDCFASTTLRDQQPELRRLSQTASSAHLLYDKLACGPAWSSPAGGSQILVAASLMEGKIARDAGGQTHVLFDHTEVPATLLWPGVWCCEAPAHAIGMVDLCLTDRHGRRCSQNTLFMYRSAPSDQSDKPRSVTGGIAVLALKLRKATAGVAFVGLFLERCSEETGEQADPSSLTDFQRNYISNTYSCTCRLGAAASTRELQLHLVQALLQQQPVGTPSPSHAFATSGRVMLPDEALHQQGMSGLSREQVLQMLIKLELDCLLSQSPSPAKNPRTIETGHSARSSTAGQAGASAPPAISLVTEHGLSLLHLLCSLGYDWAARMLLRSGADINFQGPEGFTALHWAASRGHEACVAMLLARRADPNMQTQASDSTPACTAADLASEADHVGIAAFLSESSLVHGLTQLRRTKSECPLPQRASTPLPNSSSLLRKRGRLDHISETSIFDPASSLGLMPLHGPPLPAELPAIASCPDHILDSLAAMENQAASTASISYCKELQGADTPQGSSRMTHAVSANALHPPASSSLHVNGAGNSLHGNMPSAADSNGADGSQHGGAGPGVGVGVGVGNQGGPNRTGCNPVALVAAAKQAAAVLEQAWHKREQHLVACIHRRVRHKQREEAALSRVSDSDKMWAMLKKIAQQECANGASPSPDSVILSFLSLAPRVTSLNAVVKAALCNHISGTSSMQGDLLSGHPGTNMDGTNSFCTLSAALQAPVLPFTRSATLSQDNTPLKSESLTILDTQALHLAVHHVEGVLGNSEACAQYDRLKSAVRGTRSQTSKLPGNQIMLPA